MKPLANGEIRPEGLGLRERNKLDKLDRIRRAALAVMGEKGFEKTTIREIALRAGVGHGTVFSYSRDKVELCLICIQEELEELGKRTFEVVNPRDPVAKQIVDYLAPRYTWWERYRELFFAATQQLTGQYEGDAPPELRRAQTRRAQTKGRIAQILERGKVNGEIDKNTDFDAISRILLDIYLQELRFWLNDDQIDQRQGIDQLRKLIDSLIGLVSAEFSNSPR